MRSTAFIALALSALVSAVTKPVGDTPSGNPITKPGLGEIVPVGAPYTITWTPTTQGTVSLLLLRGPSTNVVPIGAPIAEAIPNTGTYSWTPPATLEPDTLRYGIQLIVDSNGQYQYTAQFGISNPGYTNSTNTTTTTPPANGTTTYTLPTANATCVYCLGNSTTVSATATGVYTPSTLVPITPTATATASGAASSPAVPTATGAAARKEIGALVGLVGLAALLI